MFQAVETFCILTTVHEYLRPEEIFWSFGRGLSQSFFLYSSHNSPMSSLPYSSFHEAPNVFRWWKIWTIGSPLHLQSRAFVPNCTWLSSIISLCVTLQLFDPNFQDFASRPACDIIDYFWSFDPSFVRWFSRYHKIARLWFPKSKLCCTWLYLDVR